jgi:hypothetical protein
LARKLSGACFLLSLSVAHQLVIAGKGSWRRKIRTPEAHEEPAAEDAADGATSRREDENVHSKPSPVHASFLFFFFFFLRF